MDYFLLSYITAATRAERLTCSGAGRVQEKRSAGINALSSDQSDQPVLLENDITIHKRSRGAQSMDHESL